MPQMRAQELKQLANRLRVDVIEMLHTAASGHPGGSLSAIDLIVALYFAKMRHRADEPHWDQRDRFVLSKGHGVPALYATLAEAGYFEKAKLQTLRRLGSPLQGHPANALLPGIEASTGSLGQGLSVAVGMALASKLDGGPFRVYCLLGDGEIQEGQVWEAAMMAPKYHLDNLTAIIDYNKGQIDGHVVDVMNVEPLEDKWRAFNWHVLTIDGHDMDQILGALDAAEQEKGRPTLIVAHTVKGKGVSFMEDRAEWHGAAPNQEQTQQALQELKGALA